jgi:hypothetical protein
LEKVVDWHPFEHYTLDYPMGIRSQHLEPLSDGTRLKIYFKLKMPLPKKLRKIMAGLMSGMSKVDEQFNTLVRLIEVEAKNSGKVNDDQNRS